MRQLPSEMAFFAPKDDVCQDWNLVAGKEDGKKTILEFSRLLNTGDKQDRPIVVDQETKVIVAYGSVDSVDSKHYDDKRTTGTINFSGKAYKDPLSDLKGYKSISFKNKYRITPEHAAAMAQASKIKWKQDIVYALPLGQTTYVTKYFDLRPWLNTTGDQYVHGIKAIIDATTGKYVHHYVLY